MNFNDAVYWHDYVNDENLQSDLKIQVLDPCKKAGIELSKIRTSDIPQVLEEYFDVLFFDWGGMSLGNSLLEYFCRYIIKHAEDNPNRVYVMVSNFTSYAMVDAIEALKDDNGKVPFNIYLSIEDLEQRFI